MEPQVHGKLGEMDKRKVKAVIMSYVFACGPQKAESQVQAQVLEFLSSRNVIIRYCDLRLQR